MAEHILFQTKYKTRPHCSATEKQKNDDRSQSSQQQRDELRESVALSVERELPYNYSQSLWFRLFISFLWIHKNIRTHSLKVMKNIYCVSGQLPAVHKILIYMHGNLNFPPRICDRTSTSRTWSVCTFQHLR